VDGTGSESPPKAGIGINGVETAGSATRYGYFRLRFVALS
jgi:hypothetical protein